MSNKAYEDENRDDETECNNSRRTLLFSGIVFFQLEIISKWSKD